MSAPHPPQSTVVPVEPWAPIFTADGRGHSPGWEQATCHPGHPPVPVCLACLDVWPCGEVSALADSIDRLRAFLESDHTATLTGLRALAEMIRRPVPGPDSLAGGDGGMVILDDPHAPRGDDTEARNRAWDWYQRTFPNGPDGD